MSWDLFLQIVLLIILIGFMIAIVVNSVMDNLFANRQMTEMLEADNYVQAREIVYASK